MVNPNPPSLNTSYDDAVAELQSILAKMQGNELGIDELHRQPPARQRPRLSAKLTKPRPRFKRCSNDSASKTRERPNASSLGTQSFLID